MKRIVGMMLWVSLAAGGYAEGDGKTYIQLYDGAERVLSKLEVIQLAEKEKLQEGGEFYAHALRQLTRDYPNLKGKRDQSDADKAIQIAARHLGEEKYTDAASDLWRTVDSIPTAQTRAEALIALGTLPAPQYLPQIVQVLNSLNNRPVSDPEEGEKLAYGLVISLEKYQDPQGYLPVFFAANGWYSKRIRNRAVSALKVIMADPTEPLTGLIKSSSYTYRDKLTALNYINKTDDIANNAKSAAAAAALSEGWRQVSQDVDEGLTLIEIRKTALDMIARFGTSDTEVFRPIDRSFKEGKMDEQLAAVKALKALKSEDSIKKLSEYLALVNNRALSGTKDKDDEQLMRVIIPALGETLPTLEASNKTRTEAESWLKSIQETSVWSQAVRNLAKKALK